jgi:hypothetical protein
MLMMSDGESMASYIDIIALEIAIAIIIIGGM